MGKKIIWTNHTIAELNEAFLNLLEESKSITTTIWIINEISDTVEIPEIHPEIYKVDQFRKNNNRTIRTFEKHRYNISYKIEKDNIYIIRLRHANEKPLAY